MALEYGKVTGQIVTAGIEDLDLDNNLDPFPALGNVIFTPNVPFLVDVTNDQIIATTQIVSKLDSEGRLTNPKNIDEKFVPLIATNSELNAPLDWSYRVDFDLVPGLKPIPSIAQISVLKGITADLSSLITAPGSTPVAADQALSMLASAEAAATAAAASASEAVAAAASMSARLLRYGVDTTTAAYPTIWTYEGGTALPPFTGRPGPANGDLVILTVANP